MTITNRASGYSSFLSVHHRNSNIYYTADYTDNPLVVAEEFWIGSKIWTVPSGRTYGAVPVLKQIKYRCSTKVNKQETNNYWCTVQM